MTDHTEQQLEVATIDPEIVRRATLTVCDHAANPVEAQGFLAMLGLVETPERPKPVPAQFTPFCAKCEYPIVQGRGRAPAGARRHAAGNLCCNCYDRERKRRAGH